MRTKWNSSVDHWCEGVGMCNMTYLPIVRFSRTMCSDTSLGPLPPAELLKRTISSWGNIMDGRHSTSAESWSQEKLYHGKLGRTHWALRADSGRNWALWCWEACRRISRWGSSCWHDLPLGNRVPHNTAHPSRNVNHFLRGRSCCS